MPSERKVEGLVAAFSVAENMTLAALPKFVSGGIIRFAEEKKIARRLDRSGSRSRRRRCDDGRQPVRAETSKR